MRKFIPGAVIAVLATAPVAAFANTQTGNLNVTTTISVSCDAPSPSGTLNLPFSSGSALDQNAQSLANTPVVVTVSCFGNPTVQHVDFGAGTHRGSVDSSEAGIRYMFRTGGGSSTMTDFLGYKLYASAQSNDTTSALIASEGVELGTGSATEDNRLTLGVTGTATYRVTGRVFEGTRTNGHASSGAVPGGTYNDVVVMTVSFN